MKRFSLWLLFFAVLGIQSALAQSYRVKGNVVSKTGDEPLIGVSILQKGTTNGVVTDIDGNYELQIQGGEATLVFSYIGMQTQELKVNSHTGVLNVTMLDDSQMIDDVVVVAYGVRKKGTIAGSVSTVKSEKLENVPTASFDQALQGQTPGLTVMAASGEPSRAATFQIRGTNSINSGTTPLFILDGVPVESSSFNSISPSDIESISVLKDASSTSIYGARAANGVVLVTTKSGSKGKTTVSYDFSYGWQNPWKKKAVLNAHEYMTIMNEMQINDGNAPRYSAADIANNMVDTDWQDEVFNYDAPVQQHQLSINGGNDKMTYFLSLGYFNQEGIVGGNYGRSNYERLSVRSNSTYKVFEVEDRKYLNAVTVGVNLGYTRDHSTSVEANSEYGSILGSAIAFSPLVPVYASEEEGESILASYPNAIVKDGKVLSLPPSGFQELTNPVAQLNRPTLGRNNSDKIVGTFYAELNILPGIKFRSSYGVDLAFWG